MKSNQPKNEKNLPNFYEELDEKLPWWVPRVKVDICLDTWTGIALAVLIVSFAISLVLLAF